MKTLHEFLKLCTSENMSLLVLCLRSGRAGPILSVSAERMQSPSRGGNQLQRSMGVSCFPPLHTPKSPHEAFCVRGGLVIFIVRYEITSNVSTNSIVIIVFLSVGYQFETSMKTGRPFGHCAVDGESRGWQGERVCNTLRAYGGHDFGPDISLRPLFAPGRFQRVRACRLSLPPARFA